MTDSTKDIVTTDWKPAADRIASAEAAAQAQGYPARELRCVGVTGTNGKSTTVHLIRALLSEAQPNIASIGTLGVLLGAAGDVIPGGAGLTTPGPDELQRVLRRLVDHGVRTVVMEVSSHALDQHRIHGVTFDAVAFTNFTRDHLDYHRTMDTYFAAKAKLISYLSPTGTAVMNADDSAWKSLPRAPRTLTVGLADGADIQAIDVTYHNRGSNWTLSYGGASAQVSLPLIGDFNVANALTAAGVAVSLGMSLDTIASRLSTLPQVPGRLEIISETPVILRDYAHTPDALERALRAVRPFVRRDLIVVFGAGGDRDPGKRPEMGAIAERLGDVIIVTSDNPRTESPETILDDIERGMPLNKHERIVDRREAIAHAIALAHPDDVVVLAGKGHETYQIIGNDKYPFDEKVIVNDIVQWRR